MRPQIVLFGDSITEQSFRSGGWGASLADTYSRKADVFNRGYGGYNTRWALFLLHHIFPLDGRKAPIAATVFFGANDAALLGRTSERQHVPVDEYKENLRKIVKHLKVQLRSSDYCNRSETALSRILCQHCFWLQQLNLCDTELAHENFFVQESSPAILVVLITPPPVDEPGRKAYAMSVYGEKAMEHPERTNDMAGVYAQHCVDLAKELGVRSINLWSKMQETDGWQQNYLSDGLHLTPEGNAVVFEEVVKVFSEAWLSPAEMPLDFPHHSQIEGENPEKAFQHLCL
ncbi:unnamed protein product [Linum tenue]|uniref:Uncharacterized protein n=1 Tax=Linum tenue TaxID=586396 RepID=A0AAV0QR28_9ROSI|nr:unnamed protein product [Linum tenue]